uniref:Uncharacterized protein n=1 Tax=Cucumis melo TaxID=3656 RepID=A0A9I9DV69_CUCME
MGGQCVPPAYTMIPHGESCVVGTTTRYDQADVSSARKLRVQLAFKDSMVYGIMQFTLSITFRYILHQSESQDIHCCELYD